MLLKLLSRIPGIGLSFNERRAKAVMFCRAISHCKNVEIIDSMNAKIGATLFSEGRNYDPAIVDFCNRLSQVVTNGDMFSLWCDVNDYSYSRLKTQLGFTLKTYEQWERTSIREMEEYCFD